MTPPTKAQAITIIKDLISKYPKGPTGKLTKDDYSQSYTYDDCTGSYRHLTVLSEEDKSQTSFGYDLHLLMEIADHPEIKAEANLSSMADDEWDWRRIMRVIYPELTYNSKAITCRARRLVRRLGKPAYKLWRSGTVAGVYQVALESGHGGSVYAYGATANDAEIVAKMMCQHAYPERSVRWTNLVSLRDVGTITSLNTKSTDAVQEEIEGKLKRIAQLKEQIEELEAKQGVIAAFSGMQIGAMLEALS